MQSKLYRCTRHAVINSLMDYFQQYGYRLEVLDERKGFAGAIRELGPIRLGRQLRIDIVENPGGVEVKVSCRFRFPWPDWGRSQKEEQRLLNHLTNDL